MKIAVLSNININPVIRQISKEIEVFAAEGYGNELGQMMNEKSGLNRFEPDMVFLVEEIAEIAEHQFEETEVLERFKGWFQTLEKALNNHCIYYISDGYLYGAELEIMTDRAVKLSVESLWEKCLSEFARAHENVRIFRYRHLVEELGEKQAFSSKMWYMGKILHSLPLQKAIAEEIERQTALSVTVPKKVLLLDLDHTLWGGLAGENDKKAVVLSDDGTGLAYKNFQRVILRMKEQGVLLGIVSKNNEKDAMDLIKRHPHMVLRPEDFAVRKINWRPKHENIAEIAGELNLGLDSFVFFDDSPTERKLVADLLPKVTVPEFPGKPEDLAPFMTDLFHRYFEKVKLTKEDLEKTRQYQENQKREQFKTSIEDFDSYLKELQIRMERVPAEENKTRFLQLMNKTNQFNLTTRRFTEKEVEMILEDKDYEVFLYRVEDCFGDYGIVSASVLDYHKEPAVMEFTMSCRVMGKNIENAVIEQMEQSARERGYDKLTGIYKPTEKNAPVRDLYPDLGYQKVKVCADGSVLYEMDLGRNAERKYFAEFIHSQIPEKESKEKE